MIALRLSANMSATLAVVAMAVGGGGACGGGVVALVAGGGDVDLVGAVVVDEVAVGCDFKLSAKS